MQSVPSYKIGHQFFVLIVSMLIAVGVTALLLNAYRDRYTVVVSHEITRPISIRELSDVLQLAAESQDSLLIDVREHAEYADEHISGAINVPLGALWSAFESGVFTSDTPIILYSNGNTRSEIAASILTRDPFLCTDIRVLENGFDAWNVSKLPIVGKLHADYIDALEVGRRISHGEPTTIIDVRDERAFMDLHTRTAVSVPLRHLPNTIDTFSKDEFIVLVDTEFNDGYAYFESLGWDNVSVLEGGMKAWTDLGYGTASSLKESLE